MLCFLPWLLILAGRLFAKGESYHGDCVWWWKALEKVFLVYVLLTGALMRCFVLVSSWIFWDVTPFTRCYIMFQFDILSLGYWLTMRIRSPHLNFPVPRLYTGNLVPLLTMPVGSDHVVLWNQSIPQHVHCSRSPIGIASFMSPHCCGFLTPRDFSSLILSVASYTFKNIFPSIFKFLEPGRGWGMGCVVAWA